MRVAGVGQMRGGRRDVRHCHQRHPQVGVSHGHVGFEPDGLAAGRRRLFVTLQHTQAAAQAGVGLGEVGPDLSNAAALGLKMLEESVLRPAARITAGYETWEVTEKDGRKTTGLKSHETATEVEITLATGEVVTIAKADIQDMFQDEGASVMPDDLTEALTVKDFQDVLAYLMMQKTGE